MKLGRYIKGINRNRENEEKQERYDKCKIEREGERRSGEPGARLEFYVSCRDQV